MNLIRRAVVSARLSSFRDGSPLALMIIADIHDIRCPNVCPECS